MALELATPDFLAAARMQPPSPFASAVGGALETYTKMSQLRMQKAAAKQQAALREVQLKSETAKLKALPEQLKSAAVTTALTQKEARMKINAAKLSDAEASHLYLGHRLANLMATPKEQRPQAYTQMKNEMTSLGIDTTSLPAQYNKQVESLGNVAVQNTPRGLADRKYQESVVRDDLNNRVKVKVARIKAGLPVDDSGATTGTPIPGGIVRPTQPAPVAAPTAPAVGAAPSPAITPTPSPAPMGQPGQVAAAPVTPPVTPPLERPTEQPTEPTPPVPQEKPATIGIPPTEEPSPPGVTVTPTKATEAAYEKQIGISFAKAQDNASKAAVAAKLIQTDLSTFLRVAPTIPTGTGPGIGYLARFSTAGQQAIKAQNRLIQQLVIVQHVGRLTNVFLGIIRNSTVNVHMLAPAYQKLTPQLYVTAQSVIEYQKFLNSAALAGIRNVGIVDSIWNKFLQENPPIDRDTGHVIKGNIFKWNKYLSPVALKGELERQVGAPQGFVYPGSPEAARKGGG